MSADVQELFDRAGRNAPAPALDADAVLRRARHHYRRRVTGVVAATMAATVVLGVGLAGQADRPTAPDPAAPLPTNTSAPGGLGRLAFELDGDIYVADWDGANPVRITDTVRPGAEEVCAGHWVDGPAWSPDGRHLAYRGDKDSGDTRPDGCSPSTTVTISDPSGRRIASFPSFGWRIAWSPDSSRVATWVDFGRTLGIWGLDGVRQALLTVPPELVPDCDCDPVWSPDGTSLLLRGVEIPVDGSTPRQLSPDDPRSQLHFEYSPNGADIAYASLDGLSVAAADGSRTRQLVPQDLDDTRFWWYGAEWSPAGDQIAFMNQPGGESSDGGHVNELTLVDVASGTLVPLADMGGGVHEYSSKIEFSPEGDQILFPRIDATGAKSLWTIRTDGSDLRRLVDGSEWGEWQTLGSTG
jgi:Tol biopolymer transport system component